MEKPLSPFSKQQLLPQEEMLEIAKTKGNLFIGIPKETKYQEKRVCLTPDAVGALTSHGHRVLIEAGAGEGANFQDKEYSEAGAEVTNDTKKVFSCPLILKVEPPSLDELEHINPQTIIISALQLKTQTKKYFEILASKHITALAFEFIKDESGSYPAVRAFSEIAGTASILIAAELLNNIDGGNGLMLGNISGVQPVEVVVLGAGTVSEFAVRSALGLGANVRIFDNSISKLRSLQTNLGRPLSTSTIQPKILLKALKRCDVVIGSVRGENRAPIIVSEEMIKEMKDGAVAIDVSIDMGGCFETSEITTHDHPTFEKHGVIHYCVPNIPSRYSRTASISISNIFTPYLVKIAEEGGIETALRFDRGLKNGLYFYHGVLTSKSVAKWFDLPYNDVNLLIF
ncbi:MAG: alanine dehydrogenase [Flavobacteriaceae bacterium]|nr:alanine dehydrogenase [Flavobacteriaceae bacterium]